MEAQFMTGYIFYELHGEAARLSLCSDADFYM